MTLRQLSPAALLLAAALAPPPSRAATLEVPTPAHPTIQSAIDAAGDGDEIVVAAGTYRENLLVPAKAIALRGASRDTTILDGGQVRSVVRVEPGATLTLSGFAITNGAGESDGSATGAGLNYFGGGLYAVGAALHISACRFTGNGGRTQVFGGAGGGALLRDGCSGTITDTAFENNDASFGGGFGIINSRFTLTGVRVAGNVAQYAGGFFTNWSSLDMQGGEVVDNRSTVGEAGGAAFWAYSSPRLTGVTISGNTAASHGGGAYASGYAYPTFTRCLVTGNTAGDSGGGLIGWNGGISVRDGRVEGNVAATGGGIVQYGSSLAISNSVVRDNRAATAGGVLVGMSASVDIAHATVTGNRSETSGAGGVERTPKPPEYTWSVHTSLVNSIVWGNVSAGAPSDVAGFDAGRATSSDIGVGALPGEPGNFSADPLFVAGDYHLTAASPCRDVGTTLASGSGDRDVDGDPRPLALGGDGLPDVGADEYVAPSDAVAPVTAATFEGRAGLAGWFTSAVTVTLTATDDGGSGVASTEYSLDGQAWTPYLAPFEVAAEGSTTFRVRSTDGAGNREEARSTTVRIDAAPPDVSIAAPSAGSAYLLGQPVLASWAAADAASGLASASATAESGAPVDTATVGAKAFEVLATDVAGNAVSQAVSYDVRYAFGGVLPPLRADGTGTSRLGAPLVVKFQLLDWAGAVVPTAVARLFVAQLVDGVPVGEVPAVAAGGANVGNLFRYDPLLAQYVFNMSTRGLPAGAHQLRIALDDGTRQLVAVTLVGR